MPVCLAIFPGACLLEATHCRLWCVSPYRTVISGVVKTAGMVAAVFAVDPTPTAGYLLLIFLYPIALFFIVLARLLLK